MTSRKSFVGLALAAALLLMGPNGGTPLLAQAPPPEQQQAPQAQPLTPDQLDDLVAPIALYPDPLLSQVLVACTRGQAGPASGRRFIAFVNSDAGRAVMHRFGFLLPGELSTF